MKSAAGDFGRMLHQAMLAANMSPLDLARRCGAAEEVVVSWVHGRDVPRGARWQRVMGSLRAMRAASGQRARALAEMQAEDVDTTEDVVVVPTVTDEQLAALGSSYASSLRRSLRARREVAEAKELLTQAEAEEAAARKEEMEAFAALNAAVKL